MLARLLIGIAWWPLLACSLYAGGSPIVSRGDRLGAWRALGRLALVEGSASDELMLVPDHGNSSTMRERASLVPEDNSTNRSISPNISGNTDRGMPVSGASGEPALDTWTNADGYPVLSGEGNSSKSPNGTEKVDKDVLETQHIIAQRTSHFPIWARITLASTAVIGLLVALQYGPCGSRAASAFAAAAPAPAAAS